MDNMTKEVKEKLEIISISEYICEHFILSLNDTQKQLLLLDQIEKKKLCLTSKINPGMLTERGV